LRALDIGGGCGGWIRLLSERAPRWFAELAIGDSSVRALAFARTDLPAHVKLYHLDCLNLGWQSRWDVVFLLDVLEHLPDDRKAICEAGRALAPRGRLFVTVPALKAFWTYNDKLAGHKRRYCRADLARLAKGSGLNLLDSRYFMFFLSPLLLVSRWVHRPRAGLSAEEAAALMARTHRTPSRPTDALLGAIFAAETPLGHRLHFPWGTSLLGVFGKDDEASCQPCCRHKGN